MLEPSVFQRSARLPGSSWNIRGRYHVEALGSSWDMRSLRVLGIRPANIRPGATQAEDGGRDLAVLMVVIAGCACAGNTGGFLAAIGASTCSAA